MGEHTCEYGYIEFRGNSVADILSGFCKITQGVCSCKSSEYKGYNRGYLGLTENDVKSCPVKNNYKSMSQQS